MRVSYRDIINRAGPPDWWGPGGVPRYGDFDPSEIDIYARQAVLYEIACQSCRRRFQVAESWSLHDQMRANLIREGLGGTPVTVDHSIRGSLEAGQGLNYGDPPNVDCCPAGATMSSLFVRVLEYHERASTGLWERRPDIELLVQPDETEEAPWEG